MGVDFDKIAKDAKRTAEDVADKAKDVAGDLKKNAERAAEDVADKAKDVAEKAEGALGDAKNLVEEKSGADIDGDGSVGK